MTMFGDKMFIDSILDTDLLEKHVRNGYVSARRHPHLPLTVFNYTPKSQYENLWDEVTLRCRGLVVDKYGVVVANCMKKFFNYGEPNAKNIKLNGKVQVTDKLDGSMGNVAFYEGALVVTTRGSFESEQAEFAHEHIMSTPGYWQAFRTLCNEDVTAVVEIIYPENRIVVDYGDMRDVVLIGAIANNELRCGKQLWIPADKVYSWPGPVVKKFYAESFEEALRIPPRTNAEGVVIYFEETGDRLKIKQEDYLIAHRFVSNLTPKNIWLQLKEGKTLEDLLALAPDEFHGLVRELAGTILGNKNQMLDDVEREFNALPPVRTRKEFADAIGSHPLKHQLFLKLDHRDDQLLESVWKSVEP